MASKAREIFERYVQAIETGDFEELERVVHPDVVVDYPQSGERLRGFKAFRAQFENYPGGQPAQRGGGAQPKLMGDDERWVITPGYTVLPLAGPERYSTVSRAAYPDGTFWRIVSFINIKDELITYAETYFAPEFEPPEWRKGLAEILPRDG